MAIMTGLVGALSAFYHDSTDINNPQHREISAIRQILEVSVDRLGAETREAGGTQSFSEW